MNGFWKRRLSMVFLFCLVLGGVPGPTAARVEKAADQFPAARHQPDGAFPYREGEVLVKFKNKVAMAEAAMVAGTLAAEVVRELRVPSRARENSSFLIASAQRSTAELLDDLRARPDVEAASPNYCRRLQRLPNDPKFTQLWGMGRIGGAEAWEKNTGSAGVVLAVLDSGVDYRHPDLAANIWNNPGEIPGNGIDDDGNGFVDDFYGFDFAANENGDQDSDPMDGDSHGTHVTGTIAAVGDNGIGVCGINWNVKVMALKCVRPNGNIYDSDSVEGIGYAVLMKRDFGINLVAINASFGGSGNDPLLEDAIAAAGDLGIAFVCAAGNNGTDNDATPFFPASYDLANIVSVAATDEDDLLASFSNYGVKGVDIAAPGVSILSTFPIGLGHEAALASGGDYFRAIPLEFSGSTPAQGLSLQLVDCGKGVSSDSFPAAVSGQIALIERGDNTFREKVVLAQGAGAVAAVIFNNEAGNFSGTLGVAGDWIPVIALSREDGLLEKSRGTHPVTVIVAAADYEYMDGTSMAAPHVCGALGLLAAQFPADGMTKLLARLYAGADHVDALAGKTRTSARLNLARSLSQSLLITLAVFRQQTNVWVVKKDFAQVYFTVDPGSSSGNVVARYGIYRSRANGAFAMIKEIAAAELQNNAYTFYDKYLDNGITYSYLVKAMNAQGGVIAVSNGQGI